MLGRVPHHVSVTLPDERVACADYRDPIVATMRRYRNGRRELAGKIAAWLDEHAEQSERCRDGLLPGRSCEHD